MKIGVISDIHSNVVALEAVLEHLKGLDCDEYLFLGDYVSDAPYTRETLDMLYEFMNTHSCRFLRGNREEYMLSQRLARKEGREAEFWGYNSSSGNLLFTYEKLTEADFSFFENLPVSFVYEPKGLPAITCCHGSVDNTRELCQLYSENTKEWLSKINTDYMLCAHTHFPGELLCEKKHYFNSGCVGIAINDYGYAQCMTIESVHGSKGPEWKPTFIKVKYDNKKVVEDIFKSGLFEVGKWFVNSNIQTFLTGTDHAAEVVELAKKLSKEAGETCEWPNIPEKYYEQASDFYGIPDYRKQFAISKTYNKR